MIMEVKSFLKQHELKETKARKAILEKFLNFDFALSHKDIENSLAEEYDRVTVYRTLKTFEEKGIIHQVNDGEALRFALCQAHCEEQNHKDHHVHFKCEECGKIFCLESVKVPEIKMEEGFTALRSFFTIEGLCKDCNE